MPLALFSECLFGKFRRTYLGNASTRLFVELHQMIEVLTGLVNGKCGDSQLRRTGDGDFRMR